ncbi:hypothetical protein Bca4012_056265 [Brassica carinata]
MNELLHFGHTKMSSSSSCLREVDVAAVTIKVHNTASYQTKVSHPRRLQILTYKLGSSTLLLADLKTRKALNILFVDNANPRFRQCPPSEHLYKAGSMYSLSGFDVTGATTTSSSLTLHCP